MVVNSGMLIRVIGKDKGGLGIPSFDPSPAGLCLLHSYPAVGWALFPNFSISHRVRSCSFSIQSLQGFLIT